MHIRPDSFFVDRRHKGLEKIMASHFWLELMKKYATWPSANGVQAENSVSR